MSTSMPAHTQTVAQQLDRLDSLLEHAPASLVSVLTAIRSVIERAGREGVPVDRPHVRPIEGPGGTWYIVRFTAHRMPWIGVQWPATSTPMLTDWLTRCAYNIRLDSGRPDQGSNQIWIYLGKE